MTDATDPIPTSPARSLAASWVAVALALVFVFLAVSWITRGDFLDDAYITYRYSRNLVSGHGIVWNVGERPVEGFTSFLHMGLSALLMLAGIGPAAAGLIQSVAGAAGMVLFLTLCARRVGLTPIVSFAALLTVAANPFLAAQVTNGLETLLAAAWMAMLGYFALRIEREGTRYPLLVGVCLAAFLGGLTRPELLLPAAATIVILMVVTRSREWKRWLPVISVFAFAGVLYLGFKQWYFGGILPLPFYVKQGGLGFHRKTALEITLFLLRFFPLSLMSAFCVRWNDGSERRLFLLLAVPAFLLCGYYCTVSDFIMGDAYRFYCPLVPHLGLLTLFVARRLSRGVFGRPASLALAASLLVLTFLLPLSYAPKARDIRSMREAALYFQVAEAIHAAEPNPRTMAIGEAGVIPYVTGWRVIDINRLNDPILARDPTRGPEVVFANPPELVAPMAPPSGFEQHYLRKNLSAHGYCYLGYVEFPMHLSLLFYARPDYADSAVAESLRAVLHPGPSP